MYKKISDYGVIGNLRTVALVALDGSIDWLCLPSIDSPSVFGALLDDGKGGRFALTPVDEWDSTASYVSGTNMLQTRFRTRSGVMELTDFMPIPAACKNGCETDEYDLYRRARILRGTMRVRLLFDPRFDYARGESTVHRHGGTVVAKAREGSLTLAASRDIPAGETPQTALFELDAGEDLWFRLKYQADEAVVCEGRSAETVLAETEAFWKNWLNKRETGRCVSLGHYQPMVNRSALVLKLLQFEETGAIAAAATTSLPEEIGGVRNWDYRFTWVRDTSFTLLALFNLGHLSETEGYLRWMERLLSEHGAESMQIMYGLRGEKEVPEYELSHLDGYKGSRPVRVGNDAARQKQLDIYGEIMDAALRLSDYVGKIDYGMWPTLRGICDHVVKNWREMDSGIWEVRGGPYHFVYSKVMCWVALDRGLTIAERYGFPADLETWKEARRLIKEEVLEKGWSEKKKSFVQHYDTEALDSSNLLLPILGFLPFEDPKIVSTVEVTRRALGHDGFLYRYLVEDGLPGGEGVFMLCSFWLVDCLIGLGKIEDAEFLLRRLEGTANHLGLFSEEYDADWREALGNFPQAFTHIGYINSVIKLLEAKGRLHKKEKEDHELSLLERLLASEILLNDGESKHAVPSRQIAVSLRSAMNVLRGAFFDTARSRVAYERMKGSDAYGEYVELSYNLKDMDLNDLKSHDEKIAFWINLYNVIVIHAVIELGIKDSVKEVRSFFKRVSYRIGDMAFTPHDIEHGILRGNRRPPYSLFRAFGDGDPRLAHTIEPLDPRIHFALVCASSSCPPIDVYTAENIGEELNLSGRTFLNAGGIQIDRKHRRVVLSRIFKWYGNDFGASDADRIRFIAPYLYDEAVKGFLMENAANLGIEYQSYDWRLNRG